MLAEIADELIDGSQSPPSRTLRIHNRPAARKKRGSKSPRSRRRSPAPPRRPHRSCGSRTSRSTVSRCSSLVTARATTKRSSNGERRTAPAGPLPSGRRAAPGTDLNALDEPGMRTAMSYELLRLRRAGHVDAKDQLEDEATTLVVEVRSPAVIGAAVAASVVVKGVMEDLEAADVSQLYPGFDILTIANGKPDRLIELKSSGGDARVQVMSWNHGRRRAPATYAHRSGCTWSETSGPTYRMRIRMSALSTIRSAASWLTRSRSSSCGAPCNSGSES